jgi:hypothetical protein
LSACNTILTSLIATLVTSTAMDIDENLGNQIESSSESGEDTSHHIDKSHSHDNHSTSNSQSQSESGGSHSGDHIAGSESRAVHRSKWIVYLVIALAAVGMGAAAYTFTASGQEDSMKSEVSIELSLYLCDEM